MRSVLPERRHVNGHDLIEGAIAEAHRHMLDQIGQGIGERLSAAAEDVLGRAPYVRRGHVSYSIEQTRACPKCHAVQSRRFSRNGSRMRHLLAVAWAVTHWTRSAFPSYTGWLFVAGTILFSFSLYLLALTGARWLGAITPLGGVAFVAGWVCLALAAWRG